MAHGITIKITRPIETRERRKDDVGLRLWTGTCWRRLDCRPRSPKLAHIFGNETEIVKTKIEFLPPDVVAYTTLKYKQMHHTLCAANDPRWVS